MSDRNGQPEPTPSAGETRAGHRGRAAADAPLRAGEARLGRLAAQQDADRPRRGSASSDGPAGETRTGRRAARTTPPPASAPVAAETGLGRRHADAVGHGDSPEVDDAHDAVATTHAAPAPPSETGPPLRRPAARSPTATAPTASTAGPVRFGPGVPDGTAENRPLPAWGTAAARAGKPRRSAMAGLLTLGLVAGVLAYLLVQPRDPVVVNGITVSAEAPPGACDVTVDVVGTVATNGRTGTLVYQWLRSDGQITAPQSQTVTSGQTSVPIVLAWSVSGKGRLDARATLRVLEPAPAEGVGGFTYSCS